MRGRDRAGDALIRQRLCEGDVAAAVDAVYREYARELRAFLRRQLWNDHAVDDVLGDVFQSLMRDLAQFRGDAALGTWLRTVARHAMVRYLAREHGRRDRAPLDGELDAPPPELSATTKNWVRRIYRGLPDEDRRMVDLWLEGWSWKDAAEQLATTEEALRKRFTRLLKRLYES